jgi:hypothetical protein
LPASTVAAAPSFVAFTVSETTSLVISTAWVAPLPRAFSGEL